MIELKNALFEDELFEQFVAQFPRRMDALACLVEFKYSLTDQIRSQRALEHITQEWERRITALVIRTKVRIAEVKRQIRADGDGDAMEDLLADLREDRDDDAL